MTSLTSYVGCPPRMAFAPPKTSTGIYQLKIQFNFLNRVPEAYCPMPMTSCKEHGEVRTSLPSLKPSLGGSFVERLPHQSEQPDSQPE
jgi:hypothetical protein